MTNRLTVALTRLVDAHRRGTRLALLFDYDGTLVPIADHPRLAVLEHETRSRLEQLARIPSVFVGVLSGRRIDNLREAVGIGNAIYVGTNGLELCVGNRTISHPDSRRGAELALAATERLREVVTSCKGAWIEEKPLGLTVHYRSVNGADRIEQLRAEVAHAIEPLSEELRVLDAAMAIEITPDLGWTKGTAIRLIVAHVGHTGTLPLYAGDEANDADALTTAAQLGGVAIGVGQLAPDTAQHFLRNPLALSGCLDTLLGMLVATSH